MQVNPNLYMWYETGPEAGVIYFLNYCFLFRNLTEVSHISALLRKYVTDRIALLMTVMVALRSSLTPQSMQHAEIAANRKSTHLL